MTAGLALETGGTEGRAWPRTLAALALASLAIFLLFLPDAADMTRVWWTSSNYGHLLLIPPLLAWLVWQRRTALARVVPGGWWPGLAIVAVAAFGWLLGWAGGLALARQLGLVLMLVGVVVALAGPQVARLLAFPLGYALFLVPFGDELTGPLQSLTADMSMAMLHLTGVPATIDGIFITTPDGYFRVAPACAGVSFLLAMVAMGVLAAWAAFRSPVRRAVFLAACVAVPVLANGLRAFATIWLAGPLGIEFAASYDHVFYGWFFFAFVLAAVLGAAWPFFDRDPATLDGLHLRLDAIPPASGDPRAVAPLAVLLAALPIGWAIAVTSSLPALPAPRPLPEIAGWQRVAQEGRRWLPRFAGAQHILLDDYVDGKGRRVSVAVALFPLQQEGGELVGFGQGAANPEAGWVWTADERAPPQGKAERITAPGPLARQAVIFYRIGNVLTGSAAAVKLETARLRLTGGDQRSAALVLSAEEGQGGRAAIDALRAAMGPPAAFVDPLAGRD